MDKRLYWFISIAALLLGLSGLMFLMEASEPHVDQSARTHGLVSGITCLVLSTIILLYVLTITKPAKGEQEKDK